MPPMVRVSDLGLYLRCPRLVYFDGIEGLPRRIDASHILLRNLILSISRGADLEASLRASLRQLEQELPLVYDVNPGDLRLACRQLESSIAVVAKAYCPFLDILLPCEVEVDLRSAKLGLSGRLDRLVIGADVPSIIGALTGMNWRVLQALALGCMLLAILWHARIMKETQEEAKRLLEMKEREGPEGSG